MPGKKSLRRSGGINKTGKRTRLDECGVEIVVRSPNARTRRNDQLIPTLSGAFGRRGQRSRGVCRGRSGSIGRNRNRRLINHGELPEDGRASAIRNDRPENNIIPSRHKGRRRRWNRRILAESESQKMHWGPKTHGGDRVGLSPSGGAGACRTGSREILFMDGVRCEGERLGHE